MARRKSYSTVYKTQRIILLIFFLTTMTALAIPLVMLVNRLLPGQYFPLVIILLAYMVLVSVLGSYLYLVSYIPFNLSSAFDPIKNDIASGRITGLEQFGKRITRFVTEFYNFSFLNIDHAFFQAPGTDLISHEDLSPVGEAMKEYDMLEKSSRLEEIVRAGKVVFREREYHLYILPVWIDEQWLGYLGLLSERRISRFFQNFLVEFEDNYLDDQLMHIIRISNQGK